VNEELSKVTDGAIAEDATQAAAQTENAQA